MKISTYLCSAGNAVKNVFFGTVKFKLIILLREKRKWKKHKIQKK